MNTLPTKSQLQDAWEALQDIYAQYLKIHDVKIPNTEHYHGQAKSIWLATLHYFSGKEVHKDTISDICQRDLPGIGRDQQVRHLKRDGWKLTGERGYHQLHPYEPSPEWITEKTRRIGRLDADSFEDIKAAYRNCCATCGAQEGRPNVRYGMDNVVLQKGHMDPDKPASDKSNIIPQCQFCNRAYRGDFVFDDKGRVRAVADIGPIERSSLEVKRKVFDWLTTFFNGD